MLLITSWCPSVHRWYIYHLWKFESYISNWRRVTALYLSLNDMSYNGIFTGPKFPKRQLGNTVISCTWHALGNWTHFNQTFIKNNELTQGQLEWRLHWSNMQMKYFLLECWRPFVNDKTRQNIKQQTHNNQYTPLSKKAFLLSYTDYFEVIESWTVGSMCVILLCPSVAPTIHDTKNMGFWRFAAWLHSACAAETSLVKAKNL